MQQSITLNLPYDLSGDDWSKVLSVYREMDGWIEAQGCWFSSPDSDGHVGVSAEPSGLLVIGYTDAGLFRAWATKLCAKLSLSLQRPVYDAEM